MDEGLKATQKAVAAQRTPCAFVLPERVQFRCTAFALYVFPPVWDQTK